MPKPLKFLMVFLICTGFGACNSSKTTPQNDSKISTTNFEGDLVYQLVFKDYSGQMTKKEAKDLMGNEMVYTINGNMYKTVTNGIIDMKQYYLGGDTLYTVMSDGKSILKHDVTLPDEKVKEFKIEKNRAEIAGWSCDLLTIETDRGRTRYYFHKDIGIDPDTYTNHEFGLWNFCIQKTGALPLKSISENKDEYVEITAKKIIPRKVSVVEFDF